MIPEAKTYKGIDGNVSAIRYVGNNIGAVFGFSFGSVKRSHASQEYNGKTYPVLMSDGIFVYPGDWLVYWHGQYKICDDDNFKMLFTLED